NPLALCLLATAPLHAHHSFAAEFDRNKIVMLNGTITVMEWVNPHAMIHLAVKNDDGSITEWRIEGNTPNSLVARALLRAASALVPTLVFPRAQSSWMRNPLPAAPVLFHIPQLVVVQILRCSRQRARQPFQLLAGNTPPRPGFES